MTGVPYIAIRDRRIGVGHPVYIVAELSANHRKSYADALALIRAAKESGADAVKLQTYTPDTITLQSESPLFRHGEGSLWEGRTLYDLYEEAYMPWEWQPKLMAIANDLGLQLFSSPFDETAVDFLESMRVPAYKIASFEIVDIPLIEKVAKTGKPMIISTGMATKDEIEEALNAARGGGATEIALLKCNSAYPSPAEEMNLATIPDMIKAFGVPVGLSDHSMGVASPVVSVALGACIVEKHFTLSRKVSTPDAAFSLEPSEFREMVDAVRLAEIMIGEVAYTPGREEAKSLGFRPSLFVVSDVKGGEPFTDRNVRSIRPSGGLHPRHLREILRRRAARDIPKGTPLDWSMVT